MLTTFEDVLDLLKKVINVDESYGYEIETKVHTSQRQRPREPKQKKARQVHSNVKVSLIVFLDCKGVVHHEFLLRGRKVNKEY